MVHTRFNELEPNPNPHINFITALPTIDPQDQENARQLLRALAAQVKPIMKGHGFVVNSFEEYEYNSVFAGRNWNHGETVELVLRRSGGLFLPTSWLMSTLCHELAHIKHMNHGPAFQNLWGDLRNEIRQLQNKGYYGDGYWSSGKRLADSATMPGASDSGELPEYMCGGAQTRSRPSFKRRKICRSHKVVPSNHTGRQTAKKRKPGSRITSKCAFAGEGLSLTAEKVTGKGKRATSKRAREERALAAERRKLSALENQNAQGACELDESLLTHLAASTSTIPLPSESDHETGSDIEFMETDVVRRETLFVAESGQELLTPVFSWNDWDSDFIFTGKGQTGVLPASEPLDELHDNGNPYCDFKGKRKAADNTFSFPRDAHSSDIPKSIGANIARRPATSNVIGLDFGKKRKSSAPSSCVPPIVDSMEAVRVAQYKKRSPRVDSIEVGPLESPSARLERAKWSCLVCTLENEPNYLACSACGATRGEEIWEWSDG